MWCIGQITGDYLARMENVLSLYHLPLNEKRPVICLDELPFQMLGEIVHPLPMKAGAVKKFDYEYERGGVASVFVAFEPLTGKRLLRVYPRRTKADYCRFGQDVAAEWSAAEVIVLVQDNLKRAQCFVVLREPAAIASLCFNAAVRVSLYAEKRLVAQYGRVGVVGSLAAMLGAADSRHRNFEPRVGIDCQRT